jgi:aspartate aminotransferase-like enzyme
MVREWACNAGFKLFSAEGYESPTVTTVANNLGIDVSGMNSFLKTKGMMISNGYGKLKDKTFRIAHMADIQPADIQELTAAMTEYLQQQGK